MRGCGVEILGFELWAQKDGRVVLGKPSSITTPAAAGVRRGVNPPPLPCGVPHPPAGPAGRPAVWGASGPALHTGGLCNPPPPPASIQSEPPWTVGGMENPPGEETESWGVHAGSTPHGASILGGASNILCGASYILGATGSAALGMDESSSARGAA